MLSKIKYDFNLALPKELVDALFNAYLEIKENFFINKFEPAELNGGKFCEACCRIIQHQTNNGVYTPIGISISNMIDVLRNFEKIPVSVSNESYRIHIPRVLTAIYNIRNKRGVGHLGGDVNPNKADSTFIVNSVDWVMAELFRVHYQCNLDDAQKIVESIVQRKISLVFELDNLKRILLPKLKQRDQTLILLTASYPNYVTVSDLISWIEPGNPSSFRKLLRDLHSARLIEFDLQKKCLALPTCIKYVESKYSEWVSQLN